MKVNKKRISFVVNHTAFFVSHRLPLAIAAKKAKFDVILMTGQAGSNLMEADSENHLIIAQINHKRVAFRSAGVNPLIELFGLMQLIFNIVRFRPHLVHCVSPKGFIYGGIAARLCRVKGLILAMSGMGYVFTDSGKKSIFRSILGRIYKTLLRFVLSHPNLRLIVQNTDDYKLMLEGKILKKSQVELILGSGVELDSFLGCDALNKEKIILLPARMLRDKGVVEFVAAAQIVKKLEPSWRFILAGVADYQNPSAISSAQLNVWQQEGIVEWLGHVENMAPIFTRAAIVCLPSYREGMPKALLEAAAAACAVITTDVVGCREAIRSGVTGELVPVRDVQALAHVMLKLIRDPMQRIAYGNAGRQRAQSEFSIENVVAKTLNIYDDLLKNA
jgi:glycosyltransferase involved in cell wall biosynthesis